MKKTIIGILLIMAIVLMFTACDVPIEPKMTAMNPAFTWTTLTDVDEQVLRVFDGSKLIAQKRNAESGIKYSEIIPNTPLQSGKTYSWQVFGTVNEKPVKSTEKELFIPK
jgi:hypothetical protein